MEEKLEELLKDIGENVGKKPIIIIIEEDHPTIYILARVLEQRRSLYESAKKVDEVEKTNWPGEEILENILKINSKKALYLEDTWKKYFDKRQDLKYLLRGFDKVYEIDNNEYYKVMAEVIRICSQIHSELTFLHEKNNSIERSSKIKKLEKIKKLFKDIQEIFRSKKLLDKYIGTFFSLGLSEIEDLLKSEEIKKERLKLLSSLVSGLKNYIVKKYDPKRRRYWIDVINKDRYDIKVVIAIRRHTPPLKKALCDKYTIYIINTRELLDIS